MNININGELLKQCRVAKSNIHGKGVFAKERIKKRAKIGSLSGVVVSLKKIPKNFHPSTSISIVEISNSSALDSRKIKNELCYINHSCRPNCYIRIYRNNVEVYALKTILKGEELTLDYDNTHHNGKLACRCSAKNCKLFI